jgi:hypothetical protein
MLACLLRLLQAALCCSCSCVGSGDVRRDRRSRSDPHLWRRELIFFPTASLIKARIFLPRSSALKLTSRFFRYEHALAQRRQGLAFDIGKSELIHFSHAALSCSAFNSLCSRNCAAANRPSIYFRDRPPVPHPLTKFERPGPLSPTKSRPYRG